MTTTEPLRTVAWRDGRVLLIDQTVLPDRREVIAYQDWREVAEAIRIMVVRGAPAIGCTAALGMALGAQSISEAGANRPSWRVWTRSPDVFRASRPTAVNLFWAVDRSGSAGCARRKAQFDRSNPGRRCSTEAIAMLEEDVETNRRMGRFGAELLPDGRHSA